MFDIVWQWNRLFQIQVNMELDIPEYQDFEIVKKLFGGAMGKTFLVMLKTTGVLFVMKRVDYLDENDKKMADEEVAQMKHLSSRYTVQLMWTFSDKTDMFVISQYCSRGDLRKVIAELQKLSDEEHLTRVWELFAQIILALNHLHSHEVIHRDIKPENIFVMSDGSVRLGILIDFGLAKELTAKDYATFAGTKMYMAAEVWMMKRMDYCSGIFSTGVVLYELITGRHPFNAPSEQEMVEKIKKGDVDQMPSYVPADLKKLLLTMLSPV
ncbi:MAG: putative NEK protein kinase [Streblomastix strix]|uniref:non-specific serine/threonine protein kinase n=1 Tax=Streblomastix strix TaxID=222440 RepID=A0A5J4VNQ6_9EUKA|nr:MAG: putative NEK protein kinase [Streblomastix strix]